MLKAESGAVYLSDTDTNIPGDFTYTWYYTSKYSDQLII